MKPVIPFTWIALTLVAGVVVEAQDTRSLQITRAENIPSRRAPAENFTGEVTVRPLFDTSATTRATGATVAFAAGARTAWHTHPRGQTLIVTEGVGRVQLWGEPAQTMRTGDVVRIPAGVKHWHGASPDQAMSHIAVQEYLDGRTVQWAEQLSAAQYAAVAVPVVDSQPRPTVARDMFGDLAPKLAQLTDDVLFRGCVGATGVSAAGSQPGDRQCAGFNESPRPVALAHGARSHQRCHGRRVDRDDYPPCVLCGLAECCDCDRRGEGSVQAVTPSGMFLLALIGLGAASNGPT